VAYTVRNLSPGPYCFAVTAFSPDGESAFSNEVCTTVPAPKPQAPTNLHEVKIVLSIEVK
jgi:hypothetical protein